MARTAIVTDGRYLPKQLPYVHLDTDTFDENAVVTSRSQLADNHQKQLNDEIQVPMM